MYSEGSPAHPLLSLALSYAGGASETLDKDGGSQEINTVLRLRLRLFVHFSRVQCY